MSNFGYKNKLGLKILFDDLHFRQKRDYPALPIYSAARKLLNHHGVCLPYQTYWDMYVIMQISKCIFEAKTVSWWLGKCIWIMKIVFVSRRAWAESKIARPKTTLCIFGEHYSTNIIRLTLVAVMSHKRGLTGTGKGERDNPFMPKTNTRFNGLLLY